MAASLLFTGAFKIASIEAFTFHTFNSPFRVGGISGFSVRGRFVAFLPQILLPSVSVLLSEDSKQKHLSMPIELQG